MRVAEKANVLAVCRDGDHRFSKLPCPEIELVAGLGVRDDAHAGVSVQHLSRIRSNPDQPNLRQVHLLQSELFDELKPKGFTIKPGDLGENVTTRGLDLLALSRDTVLKIGCEVSLRVTGLRNPCAQIENFLPGLLKEVACKTRHGLVRKAGIMTIVLTGGTVRDGDQITVETPGEAHIPLEPV